MTDWTKRLAIVSDEASESFEEAVDICLPLGIGAYELRSIDGSRFPQLSKAAVDQILQLVDRHHLTILGVSPGFCKCSVGDPRAEEEFQTGFPEAFRLMEQLSVRRLTTFSYLAARPSYPIRFPMQWWKVWRRRLNFAAEKELRC